MIDYWYNTTMSEYIEIEEEATDDPDITLFHTNLPLTDGEIEEYDSIEAMEEGSPVAQALAVIVGIVSATLEEETLTIRREPYFDWYAIAADVSAVLKDFFLWDDLYGVFYSVYY